MNESIKALKADPKNPRKISAEAMAGLGVSLETFGDLSGIVWNRRTGHLVAGHQRLQSLREAGAATWKRAGDRGEIVHPKTGERFPIRVVDWEAAKERMANLTANNPEIQGDFTVEGIEQLGALTEMAGFEALRLDALRVSLEGSLREEGAPAAGNTDPDAVPERPKVPVTRPGDLWLLGDHRLLCGDSTKAEDVARLMAGAKAAVMNTDPPYGIDYTAIKAGMISAQWKAIENDELTDGKALQTFLESAIRTAVPHLTRTCAFYLWHPMLTQGTFFAAAAAADILIHRQIIWVKPQLILTRSGMYHWKHELCFYGWVRGSPPPWYGPKTQTSVLEAGRDQDAGQHPTQKPVALFEFPMANHTRKGGVCYEPFSGSGSQIIAGERMGRSVRALELDPGYCDVAVTRWEAFTGKRATRQPATPAKGKPRRCK